MRALREVGPRDGFQNEPEVIPTDDKVRLVGMLARTGAPRLQGTRPLTPGGLPHDGRVRLVGMLARTGVPRLEVTSFVRPDVIPQLADGPEVLRRADVPEDVSVSVLIPNERGLDNALELREHFGEVNLFLSASETHNQKNVNRSVEESLLGLERVIERARAEG